VLEGSVDQRSGSSDLLQVELAAPEPGAPLEVVQLRVRIRGIVDEVEVGERVRVLAHLYPIPEAANPGESDLAFRERREGVVLEAVIKPGAVLHLSAAPLPQRLAGWIRHRILKATANLPDSQARGLIEALSVGRREEIPEETDTWFGNSGLAHLLAVAGLHVGVMALALRALLRLALVRWEGLALRVEVGRLAGALTLPLVWTYVVITGSGTPAVRAAILVSLLLVARNLNRSAEVLTTLAWAATAILAHDPGALWDPAFQLSFGAVTGLALLHRLAGDLHLLAPSPEHRGLWKLARTVGRPLAAASLTSVAVSVATVPVLAATFHRVSLVSPLANAVALPVGVALAGLCSLAPLTVWSPWGLSRLLQLAVPLAQALVAIAREFGDGRFAVVRLPAFSASTILAWYGLLVAASLSRHRRSAQVVALGCAAVLAAHAALYIYAPQFDSQLQVTFLSVGQGDSAVIRLPGGEAMLIDGGGEVGGRYDPGERVVLPFLLEEGVTHLRALILSHPHPDHALGLITVAQSLPADAVWLADQPDDGDLVERLISAARRGSGDAIPIRRLSAGTRETLDGVRVEVLGPPPKETDAPFAKVNDQSLVLRLTFGEVSFLFPGDIERAAEPALLTSVGDAATPVLKAPHHGSNTSSTPGWVARVHPRFVVYCVGLDNRFGFPSAEVDARYAARVCVRLRTDRDGAIAFRTDGHRVSVDRFKAGDGLELQLE
jgi:competence protein ComEC